MFVFLFFCLICTFTYCLYAHLYVVALRGGNTTPSLVADAFVECEQVTGLRQRLLRFSYALQLAHVPELEPDVILDI
jgi:hypothetical protein